jgi:hypothetical protein
MAQLQSVQLQIVNRIEALAEAHKMVQEFRYGFLTDMDDLPDYTTPVVYLVPEGASYPSTGKINYNFSLVCFDMLLPDKSNLKYVISDTQGILNDIYTRLLYQAGTGTYTPFQEQLKDYVAGNTLTLTISAFMEMCSENLPFV